MRLTHHSFHRQRSRRFAFALTLVFSLLLCLAPQRARAETWGQYLVVIDDSGSMNISDPDRLVMMASLALGAALGDSDQVMIVGLNQLANGEVSQAQFLSPRVLLEGRDGDEGARALEGPSFEQMAEHNGGTPCRAALAQARDILEEVASSGAPQTLLLLTDGKCQGGVDPAMAWLAGVSSHRKGEFRFALLTKGSEGVDPALTAYAEATGWTEDPSVSFDGRSLLRAFAQVLSFSRGLRFDGGGIGDPRTFAGAREVRVLALQSQPGQDPAATLTCALTDASMDSRFETLVGGPTFRHADYPWRLRVTRTGPRDLPFNVSSTEAGVEVLPIPSYGKLRVEAVVVPCPADPKADKPALPWTRERAVRSGQPACAYARLVGDSGETIEPARSFDFDIELCEDEACTQHTAMQPDSDGSFNAQLGVLSEGRHERWFRADHGALARPVVARRAIQSSAFGITSVARADKPDAPIESVDLGVFPKPVPTVLTLQYAGSFPEGSEAEVRCAAAGGDAMDLLGGEDPCVRCEPSPATAALQDPFTIQVTVSAASYCPAIQELAEGRSEGAENGPVELPLALELTVSGKGSAQAIGERRLALTGTLRQAAAEPQQLRVTGGSSALGELEFPAPVSAKVELSLEPSEAAEGLGKDLEFALVDTSLRLAGDPGERASVKVELRARDCCQAGEYPMTLRVRDTTEGSGSTLTVPVTLVVAKPSFWVCPGKTIAKIAAALLGLGLLIWLIRGFTSPHKFAETAVLARAESHKVLSKLSEGDEDWRLIRSLETTKRAFYKHATVHLGGAKAALPSLRGLGDDARIEARGHGNAALVIDPAAGDSVETFKESSGWQPLAAGEHPIGSSIVLRRDDTYLMFRR